MGNALYARSRLRRGDEALGLHGQGTENSDGINGGSSESRSSWRMIPDSFSGSIWMLDVSRKQAINYRQIKKAIQEELDDRVLRDDDSSTGFQNMLERISELPPKSIHDEAQKALSKWLKDDRVKCLQNREDLKSIDLHGWLLYGDTPCGKFIVQAAIKSRQFILHNMVERVLQKSSSNSMHEKNVLFAENTRKISKANHVSDAEKFELIQVLRKVLRFFNSFGHDAKNVGLRIEMLHELASILQLCPFRSLDISQIADFRLEGKSRTSDLSSVISELAEFLKDMLFRESDLSVKNSRSIISYDESIEIVRVSCGLLHATSSGWAMIFVLKACLDLIERVPNLEPKLDLLCIECFQEIFSDDTIPQKLASDWNHFVNQCEKDKEGSCFTLMSLCWELVVFQVQHSESSLVEVQGFWECRYFNVLTTDDFSLSCLLLWIRSLCESFTASQEIWNKLLSSQSYLAYDKLERLLTSCRPNVSLSILRYLHKVFQMIKMNFYLRNRQEFRVKHSIEDPALIKQLIYILEEVSIIVDDEGSEFCFSMSSKISFSDVENIFEIVTSLIERFSLRFFPAILDWSSLSSNILTSLGISQNELRLLNSLLARDDFGSKLLENLLTIDLPNTSQRSPAPYNLSENICKFVSSSQRIFFPSTAKRVRFLSELFLSAFPEHFDGNTLHKRRFSIELNHNQAFRVLGHVLFQIRTFESTSSSISDMLCGGDQDIWINHIVPSLNLLKSTDLSIRRFCRIIIDSQFDDSFSERYKNHLTPNIMTNLEKADSPITPSSEMIIILHGLLLLCEPKRKDRFDGLKLDISLDAGSVLMIFLDELFVLISIDFRYRNIQKSVYSNLLSEFSKSFFSYFREILQTRPVSELKFLSLISSRLLQAIICLEDYFNPLEGVYNDLLELLSEFMALFQVDSVPVSEEHCHQDDPIDWSGRLDDQELEFFLDGKSSVQFLLEFLIPGISTKQFLDLELMLPELCSLESLDAVLRRSIEAVNNVEILEFYQSYSENICSVIHEILTNPARADCIYENSIVLRSLSNLMGIQNSSTYSCLICEKCFYSGKSFLSHDCVKGKIWLGRFSILLSQAFLRLNARKCLFTSQEDLDSFSEISLKNQEGWLSSEVLKGGIRDQYIVNEVDCTIFTTLNQFIEGESELNHLDERLFPKGLSTIVKMFESIEGIDIRKLIRRIISVSLYHLDFVNAIIKIAADLLKSDEPAPGSSNHWVFELWRSCYALIPFFVQQHQNGVRNQCNFPGCQKECTFNDVFYKCDSGHESTECLVAETYTYAEITSRAMEKCEFMLKLNSFLSQTKESMGIQESSKLNGEGIFSDQIFRKIIKAVIQFIQDVEVDVPFLQEELTHSAHRAISRSQAFEDFAKCFERYSVYSPYLLDIVVVEVMDTICKLRFIKLDCDPHYLTGLDNSGKSCRLKVVESFCRLKDKVFNLFLELKKNRNRDLLANPLKMNLILNFFKLRFTNQEFIKISYLDLIREFRELDSFKEVFTTIAYDLYLAMAVLVFYSQQNFSYMLTIAPKRSSAFYNPAPRSLSIVMDHVLQEEECKSQTIALCMSVLESLKRLTCSDIALNETNVFLALSIIKVILSSKLIGGLQKKSISTDIVETPAIRLYLQNESNIELLLYYFYTLIANDESSLLSPRNERTLLSVIGILVPFIGIDEFLKIISKTWHNDHHFFEKPKTHFDFVCYLFKLIGLLKFSWILQCHTNPITPKNSCKNRISGLILILYQMCASRWMSIIIQSITFGLQKHKDIINILSLKKTKGAASDVPSETLSDCYLALGILMFLSGDIGIIEEENECEKSDANPILVKNVQSRNKVKSQDLDFLEHASQQVQNFRENGIRYTHSIFPSFPYQLLRIVSDILNNFCPGTHERRKSSLDSGLSYAATDDHGVLLVFFHTYASKAFYRMLPSFLELNADLSSTNILEHAHRLVEIANTPLPLSTSMSISQLEIYCSRLDDQIRSLSQAKVSTPSNLQNSVEVFFQELLSRCSDSHYFHIELCKNASFLFHDDVDRVDKAMRWMNEKSFEQINDKNDDKAHNRSHTKKLHILFPKEDSLNDVSVFIKQATILSNLGFPRELCEHALMITNGNESLAAQWLFDHSKSIHSTPTDDMSEYLKSLASDNWGFPGIDNFFEPKNIFFSLNSFDTVQFNRLMDGKSTLNFSKQGSSLPVKPVDVRKGLGVRISSKWLKDALLMSKQNSNTTHIWYMHTNQNTWDPFEPKVSMELEERWNSGQSCCFAMLDDESFLFHFDRMVMYHSETGYLTRIRRRNISPDVVNLSSRHGQKIDSAWDLHFKKKSERWNESQQSLLSRLIAIFPQIPERWCVQALSRSNFRLNVAAEWIMENRNNLEKFYSDFMECSSKNIVSTFESQETSLNPSKSRYDLQLLLSLYDKNGTIIQGNKENAVVKFENDSRGKSLEVNVPLESLEFVDSWIFESFPELKRRKNLGVYGLLIDSFVSLSIKFLRISILKLLDSLVSLKKTPDIEPMDSYTTCSISSNILDLTVNDLLSFLKLVSHDFYSNVDVHKKILRVLYAFNSSELLDLLIDDTVLLLRFESQQVIDYQTEHPYWRRLNVKECVEFPAAREIAFEFDFRTSLKQGQAVVIFSKDEAGKEELLVLSGSFGNCVPSSVFGFMPVIVPGNCVWIHFVCCDSKTDPSDFGLFFRARPISYDYKDERDIFQAPLGWLCFKYLLSKRKTLDDQMMIVEQTLESRKFPSLFSSLLRYILCKSSPRKAFVTNIICEFLYLIGSKKLDESVKSKILSSVEVLFLFQKLQELLDYLREGEMGKTAYIYGYSSFYQSLCSMFSILRQVYPRFGYLSISFFPKENDVSKTSVFDIKVSFGKNYNLDLARVEICLCRLLSSNLIPSSELIDMAYERLSVENSYRACLKELETNIKISKQSPGWKDLRKRWVSICNSFHGPSQGRELLSLLKSSISDSAFVFEWVVQQKEWSKKLENCIEYETLCGCLLQFEASLIWNDEFEDNRSSPLIPSWRSIRENWRRTVRALADGTAKNAINSLPSVSDARSRSWNLSQDLELVAYIDYIIQTRGRRIKSLNVVDIGAAEDICLLEKFPSIASVPAEALRSRFAYIKLINHLISTILLPAADLSVLEPWSLGNLLVRSKNLMFLDTKLGILHQKIQPLISKENEPQTVILNRHEASKQGSSFENTLFCQLFQQLSLVDANYLRRKTQSWKVKFVGEEGHDVGGLYNASITDICTELMSDRLPLFVRSPNGAQNIGECREKFVPNSGATSNDHLAWFEFFGRLVGISCMSMGKTLSVELASVVWKWIVREALSLDDIKLMDYSCWRTIQILKYPEKEGIDAYNFEHYFEDVYFVVNRVNGEEHELILNGSSVELTWDNKDEYVRLLLEFKFNEFEKQLVAIGKGIASIVPYEFLALFSWRQLENVVCGSSVIDIELLKEKTVYHGGIRETDEHIGWFWEILSEFSPKDREAFLQFVWGRARLPSSRVGFGKDVFKISEHKATLQTSNLFKGTADQYLPVAHTCFFALELPRYSTKSVLLERLMYAIHNCKNIDGDTTHESQMNLNMAWSPED